MRERLQPGAIIDGFRVGEYLHKGGTGFIYHVTAQPEKDPGFPIVMKAPALGPGEPLRGYFPTQRCRGKYSRTDRRRERSR